MFAPEGFGTIALFVAVFIVATLPVLKKRNFFTFSGSGVALILLLIVVYFFRDPELTLPPETSVVSPVTGTIMSVEETASGGTHITIFLSLFDQHSIRVAATGSITSCEAVAGKYHPANLAEAGTENEHVAIKLQTEHGIIEEYIFAGFVARRIMVYSKNGDTVKAGERIGFIRFGSRAELVLPPNFQCDVEAKQKLKGGITVLGSFVDSGDSR